MTSLGCLLLSVLVLGILTPHTSHAFSDFQVVSPPELMNNSRFTEKRPYDRNSTGIYHTPAMFGKPQFGITIWANLFHPSNPDNRLACSEIDKKLEPNWPSSGDDGGSNPFVLLLARGDCTFKTKVRNAARAGATVAIVYARPGEGLIYMADDTTDSFNTPSIFILNSDAQLLIAQLNKNATVTLAMTWSFRAPDARVEWDLWTSSRDVQTTTFKQVFGQVEKALGVRTFFTPHYLFAQIGSNLNCMNRGRYCVPDPNENTPDGVIGRDLVRENLRQICISRQLKGELGVTETWWQYVSLFEIECYASPKWQECGEDIIKRLNINLDAVNLCMNVAPLNATTDTTHPVIEEELKAYVAAGRPFLPTVVINEEHYRGDIECPAPIDVNTCHILQALCAGFMENTKPDACFSNGCGFGIKRDCRGVCGGNSSCDETAGGSLSIGAVIGIVIGGMVLIGIFIVIYMKRQKKALEDGMDHMLRQYLPMEDSESINNHSDRRSALNTRP